jgi:hypothetical protein
MLRRANRLMEERRYAQAYPLLRRVADGAAQRDTPVRAAHLYLRAAHARLEMGGPSDALALARRAIYLLTDAGQGERLRVLLPPMIESLRAHGYHEEAIGLRAEMRSLTGGPGGAPPPAHRAALPSHCPACGTPVHTDAAPLAGTQRPKCAYCGMPVQARSPGEDRG